MFNRRLEKKGLDFKSIDDFLYSLPEATPEINELLFLYMTDEDWLLSHRGFLGCLTIATVGQDQIALRLLPGRSLAASPVIVAMSYLTEGITVAPDLDHFVAGRLVQMDAANPENLPNQELQSQLLQFARQFGKPDSTEAVLNALEQASKLEDYWSRSSTLLAAADPNDALFKTLSMTNRIRGEEMLEWAKKAIHEMPDLDIVLRLYVATQLWAETGEDITEAVIKLISGDNVYDPGYTGFTRGSSLMNYENEAFVKGTQWLQTQDNIDHSFAQSDLWKAAQQYAKDPYSYDGSLHLEAAKKIASTDPVLAYTHTANAAAFFVRSSGGEERPREAITFAHQLAKENGWEYLRDTLNYALERV